MLSTPRLADNQQIDINLPFNNKNWDELFAMREKPKVFGEIRERLAIEEDHAYFQNLFTETPPHFPSENNYCEENIRVRYFGHACVLVQSERVNILVDPWVSQGPNPELFRYYLLDLPDQIDYVLITHAHADHVVLETLLQIRYKIKNIIVPKNISGNLADPSLKLCLKNLGFDHVYEIDDMEEVPLETGFLMGIPFLGEHGDINVASKTAYLLSLNQKSVLFAADSANLEPLLYDHIQQVIGKVNIIFLGMECHGAPVSWVYGARFSRPLDRKTDQTRRLSGSDFNRAVALINSLNCDQVYIYAMGMEPWLSHVMALAYTDDSPQITESNKLLAYCSENNKLSKRLYMHEEWIL